MLFLVALAIVLAAAGVAFTALGVEDNRFHNSLDAEGGNRLTVPVHVSFWEDSLPGKPSLPWSKTTAEWIAAVQTEGK